jgi:hypothetical protein
MADSDTIALSVLGASIAALLAFGIAYGVTYANGTGCPAPKVSPAPGVFVLRCPGQAMPVCPAGYTLESTNNGASMVCTSATGRTAPVEPRCPGLCPGTNRPPSCPPGTHLTGGGQQGLQCTPDVLGAGDASGTFGPILPSCR